MSSLLVLTLPGTIKWNLAEAFPGQWALGWEGSGQHSGSQLSQDRLPPLLL